MITRQSYFGIYGDFVSKDSGVLADIAGDYSVVLKELADSVIDGVQNMVIHEIYPTEGLVNKAQTVSVKATGLNFDEGFKVTLGGENVENLKKTDTGFEFTTPITLGLGSYDICVTNGTGETPKTIGQYTYVSEESDIGYKVLKIEPASGEEGEGVLVKVTVDKITYKDGFSVTVGGKTAEVQEKESGYFTFNVPTTLSSGIYDIIAFNSKDKKIGKFIVTGNSAPELLPIESIAPTTMEEGSPKEVSVKLTKSISYKTDFKITVGGKDVTISYTGGKAFRFIPSKELTAGTYDIDVTNDGTTQTIGTVTVTAR